jgi:hypothetical protein
MLMRSRTWIAILGAGLGVWSSGLACGDDDSTATDVPDVVDRAETTDDAGACPTGQERCEGECVNTQTSAAHCGECGHACGSGQFCRDGECHLDCPPGPYGDCGGSECTSLNSDPANCGECGNACGTGEVCSCGECQSECGDLNTDAANCGVCGGECDSGDVCCCGECMAEADCPETCTMVPIPDQLACGDGDACVDTRGDLYHCGECDNPCTGGDRCGDGICTSEICTGEDVYCEGHCTNLNTSQNHCGRCGNACDPERENCMDGVCRPSG